MGKKEKNEEGAKMICKCGFEFANPGEFRNCEAFVTDRGESGVICPKCDRKYIEGREVKVKGLAKS